MSIAIPMPAMFFGSSDHCEIKDFKLRVDGKPIKTQRKLVILLGAKTDISKKVVEYGWIEKNYLIVLGMDLLRMPHLNIKSLYLNRGLIEMLCPYLP
jgi:hypothetical protein